MSQYSEKLIGLLRADYPDLSGWTVVCASDRAVDPVENIISSALGGILPRVAGLNSYITEKIACVSQLQPLLGDEQLLYFIEFLATKFPDKKYPARHAGALLPLIAKFAEYQISRNTICGAERFTEEEWRRLEEYLAIARAFRQWLSKKKFFLPELEVSQLDKIMPGEKEIFIGLPGITPLTERFYKRINKDRLFIEKPLFSRQLSAGNNLPFDSAKNLVLSFGGAVEYSDGAGMELVKLAGLPALVDLVTMEVGSFLADRGEKDQMMIFLLDESLTSMLWNRSLRQFGSAVNLAVWLPFTTTAAGRRLAAEIDEAEKSGRIPDFKRFATICAMELAKKRETYVREECEALEAAVSFSTLLDEWQERLGKHLTGAAQMLLQTRKFRITGSRTAPIQVVGFGHISGEKFRRGLILPLDSGVLPTQPYEGPFINPVHVPKMRKTLFEYEDLVFRQILFRGEKIKIVGVNDPIRERTPGFYLNLLAQEFGKQITPIIFKETLSARRSIKAPAIPIDAVLRDKLRDFTYSYSSLSRILACPFLFYHQYILKIIPPFFMDDDKKINMRMGEFVHKFLQQLATVGKNKLADWEHLFDKLSESNDNAAMREIKGINIYLLNAKIFFRGIYDEEKESGKPIIFADNAIACEKSFNGMIAGSYKITGFVDRVAKIKDHIEVIDFKYSPKQNKYYLSQKTTVLARFLEKGILHPAAQLIIYQHFNQGAKGARFYFLKETAQDREMILPAEDGAKAEALLWAIKERLDAIIGGNELRPAPDAAECEYCRLQALCGREDYYKDFRGNF